MRTLDGEHLGNNRIKLGFGKSLHTNCVWVDGVAGMSNFVISIGLLIFPDNLETSNLKDV